MPINCRPKCGLNFTDHVVGNQPDLEMEAASDWSVNLRLWTLRPDSDPEPHINGEPLKLWTWSSQSHAKPHNPKNAEHD